MKKPLQSTHPSEAEEQRLLGLMEYETKARLAGYLKIAGVDEVGRGPLAGPLVACAAILSHSARFWGINDSKKVSSIQRERLYAELTQSKDVQFAICAVSHEEIDRINIHQATLHAMAQAIATLPVRPDFLLVDGLHLPRVLLPHQKIVKGDALSQSIAAASILAKVTRDRMMVELHEQWPEYGFDRHKGYGTPEHLKAIKTYGLCPIHRKSFSPCASVLS